MGIGGLTRDATYVYSCMVLGDTVVPSKLQVFLMKFDSTLGTLIKEVELSVSQALDCQVVFTTSQVLLTISYSTGTTELISFASTGTNLNVITTARLRFSTTNYKQTGMGRTSIVGSAVWFFFPSLNTISSLQSMFITYMTDVTNMNWPPLILCTEIH